MKSTLRGRLRSSEENHCSYMKESAEVVQHLIWILVDSDSSLWRRKRPRHLRLVPL